MIIFTPIQNIPIEYLEYKGIRQVIKYNLSAYYNDAPSLEALVPTPSSISSEVIFGDCTNPAFDMEYHKYIMDNPIAFLQFMSIIVPAYTNPDVLVQITIQVSDFRDVITESLLKLIQQRYGYNACLVYDVNDFLYTEESDFSIPGLFILDQDLARWRSMTCQDGDLYE